METIYQHYRSEEQPFINEVMGWIQQAKNTYAPYLTYFLTPREAMITEQLVARDTDELCVSFDGGYPDCERQRALIYYDYYEPMQTDFDLQAFNIKYPTKFGQLTHGQILGTFISTGVDRNRIGDIITDLDRWHIIVDQRMGDYFMTNINKIASHGVKLEPIPLDDLLDSHEQWRQETLIASSLRLDTLLGKAYNFSRQRAKEAIYSGAVKVNFVEVDRPDILIDLNDIISMRKFGRFAIKSVDGKTKKDNYRLTINVLEK